MHYLFSFIFVGIFLTGCLSRRPPSASVDHHNKSAYVEILHDARATGAEVDHAQHQQEVMIRSSRD